jgi:hypothetical protein
MKIGSAQWDITPKPGVELSGFLNREQPSVGIQDSLLARALYLEQDGQRVLWIHADLLGWDREFVLGFRAWAEAELGLKPGEVLLSATHTHGAPAVLRLLGCGRVEEAYATSLRSRLEDLAGEAKHSARYCRTVFAHGSLDLAVDRRRERTSATDPRLTTVGWRAPDGPFLAAAAVYSMHPVAMGGSRLITADWPGRAAAALQNLLPGGPVALVSSGACGNLNPPQCGASEADMHDWGDQVGETAGRLLAAAEPSLDPPEFRVASRIVTLPLDAWDEAEITRWTAEKLESAAGTRLQDRRYRAVLESWRENRLSELGRPGRESVEAELFALRFGPIILMGVNAEVFCQFALRLREQSGRDAAVLGCCNGLFGYLPHEAAYDEGGYEPNSSFLFYDRFRVRRGSLEFLADQAVELAGFLFS